MNGLRTTRCRCTGRSCDALLPFQASTSRATPPSVCSRQRTVPFYIQQCSSRAALARSRVVAEDKPSELFDPEYERLENADQPSPQRITKRLSRKQADWPQTSRQALLLEGGEQLELARQQQQVSVDGSLQIQMVQWYPGHIARAERQLQDQLKMVDVVLEVRDARIPVSTNHPQASPASAWHSNSTHTTIVCGVRLAACSCWRGR